MKTLYLFLFTILLNLLGTSPGLAMALINNITTDHSALLALKSQLRLDPSHGLSMNWSNSTSVCHWIGVTCGSRHHERVTGLDLSSMNLTTSLPPQIGNLSFLVSLNLSNNYFFGNIPQELTHLRRLRILDFRVNRLTGEIPSWFNLLSNLEMLYLRNNGFTGCIPPLSNMSNIKVLYLGYNTLQGNIPTEIGDLPNLKTLALRNNQLSGSIPLALYNITTMEMLDLVRNNLNGNLPESMCGGLFRLEWLRLAGNHFSGEIPPNMSNCSRLRIFSLSDNHFSGFIPGGIGNLRRLEELYLYVNSLTGQIPSELSNITMLRVLNLRENQLTGSITTRTFNISSLQYLNIGVNNLYGTLPADMWSHLKQLQKAYLYDNKLTGISISSHELNKYLPIMLPHALFAPGVIPQYEIENLFNLEAFAMAANNFSGSIPVSLFNISTLKIFSVSDNQLVGNLPPDLGLGLPNLEVLELHNNSLGSASVELSFITSLTNCRNLRRLTIDRNPLNGVLLPSIGNFSTSLQILHLYNCGLRGRIPDEIGNLINLIDLSLWGNNLTGTLPRTLANIQSLQGLDLSVNKISGTIPGNICELENLIMLFLNDNEVHGPIPLCIGNITTLSTLDLSINNLNGTIPISLWHIRDILNLNLSSNSLTGNFPIEVGNLRSVNVIDFSLNQLSGTIPATIGNLQPLVALSLSNNRLEGPIPETIARIVNLEFLDLSHNNLSGGIPALMENLVHLNYLNVSFNGLGGEIPSGGPFGNFTSQSFMFNDGLCGDPRYNVAPCREAKADKAKGKWKLRVILIILGALIFLIAIVTLAYGFARARVNKKARNRSNIWAAPTQLRISYYELLEATDRYSESNLIGGGSFGSVYRGTLRSGKVLAVKVFHEQREGAFDSFEVECEVLRKLRHRNLCKVIGCCSNQDFKALIVDYMPNGSLEELLYSTNSSLDLVQRISIMVDVASALEYLHYGYSTAIVHCDLKPSNILLDENMVGHLCDFGLAKLLGDGETATQTITLATLGYIAPEFGTDGRVSIRSDVYSYGITMMEVFTTRKPNDERFTGDSSLRSWVADSMAGSIVHIIDPNMIQGEKEECSILKLSCAHSIMELALRCSCESPHDRINIKDVNASLKKIRNQLL